MNPNKGHLLMPGTDHAYCGLTLAPEDDYLINSGYDAYYWVIEENRKGKVDCGDCTRWRDRWTRSAYADRGRPTERRSHLTEEQWADMDEAIIAKWKQFEMKARWVADQLGATIIEEAA